MAVVDGFTSTSQNDLIAPSRPIPFVIAAPRATPIYDALAWQIDMSKNESNVGTLPSRDAAPATTNGVTETDEVARASYTTSGKAITGQMIATRGIVSDQFTMDSGMLGSGTVDEMGANVRNTIDVLTLALFATATNMTDNTGVNMTTALWAAGLALFKAQKPGGIMCYIGSPAQNRDIDNDLANNAGGAQIQGAGLEIFTSGMVDGYKGMYRGVAIFESSNVAEADGANDVGGFISIVPGPNGPTRSGLAIGVWHGVQARGKYEPERFGEDVVVAARVGFSRSVERMVRGMISKRAA
jgi:hypothetical protein